MGRGYDRLVKCVCRALANIRVNQKLCNYKRDFLTKIAGNNTFESTFVASNKYSLDLVLLSIVGTSQNW